MSRDIFDIDNEMEAAMNVCALQYDLQPCREHRTYVPLQTLASAIYDVLRQSDTEELIGHLSAHVKKGE